jgi:hypothetical protein
VPQLNLILPPEDNTNDDPAQSSTQLRTSNILNGHNFSPFNKIV